MIDDKHLNELIERYPALAPIQEAIASSADAMKKSIDAGGKILVCGNGGSAADADHIVGELMKSFVKTTHSGFPETGPPCGGRRIGQ